MDSNHYGAVCVLLVRQGIRQRYFSREGLTLFLRNAAAAAAYWFVFSFCLGVMDPAEYAVWLLSGILPFWVFRSGLLFAYDTLRSSDRAFAAMGCPMPLTVLAQVLCPALAGFAVLVAFCLIQSLAFGVGVAFWPAVYYWLCAGLFSWTQAVLLGAAAMLFPAKPEEIRLGLFWAFWLTPIAWPVHVLPPLLQTMFRLNPLTYVSEGMRATLLNTGAASSLRFAIWFYAVAGACLFAGMLLERHTRRHRFQLYREGQP